MVLWCDWTLILSAPEGRQAEDRAVSLRQRRKKKKQRRKRRMQEVPPALQPTAPCWVLWPFLGRVPQLPPSHHSAGKRRFLGTGGKDKKNLCPRQKYRQNNVSNYKAAFFFSEVKGNSWWDTSIWFTVPLRWGSSKRLQCNWELRTVFIYSLIAS